MLIKLVRRAAAVAPDQPAVISPGVSMTYEQCLERSESVARGLRLEQITRFGSAISATAEIVTVLVGSSAAGAEACLYPRDLEPPEIGRLAARFGHEAVITDEDMRLDTARAMPLPKLMNADGPLPEPPAANPVLILTTGTTGEQKGARHEWSRLVRSVRRPDDQPGTRWLLAYNLNQFAGIQILLHVFASQATLVVPASRRPEEVIEAIRSGRVTHISATPTFWRLVVGRLDKRAARELPLEQITLGGEAAPGGLIERLRALFPDARLSHVYAGTEFGSAVSVGDGRAGLPMSVLDRGEDAPVQLRIVGGELQIRSQVGMLGYHQTDETLNEWRATGDMVEVRGDRIMFVGRTTEIINVGGAKVHPLPVEEVICRVPGVQIAAVYGRPNAVTGQIVAADIVSAPGIDHAELEARVREACQGLPAAGRPRRIRFVEEVEIKGNKLMRREAG